ncbi:NADH-quinone oxidoreductase subunit N [Halorientalis pallida]|uniref:NADH-quinone oxidoreductase subunit N n=1 Tax=Halorientalis pallida TaxID=2479928 RepID=A0A498KX48_9EURY|nr:NADH-quinone oxidoreductase subunit N [Halorientalis pallida]RXK49516.1 NADH-quinone oxidoreductase subunit N [Halorientalis pallida]
MIPLQTSNTLPDWAALAPAIILAVTALALFLIDSIDPNDESPSMLAGVATLGSVLAMVVTGWYLVAGTGMPRTGGAIELFSGQLVVDGMSLFFTFIFTSVTALVCVASYDYLSGRPNQAEYYALVLLAATGMSVMASANSLATAFVALELSSLPSYGLVAYLKNDRGSVEAGLKYFLIGAVSSAVLAYGISLVYASAGVLELAAIAEALGAGIDNTGVLGVGILMVAGGFAFKTASVPFHFWAPEAYEGAPAPVSGFLSSASKAAGFVLAFRVFVTAFPLDVVAGTIDWALAFTVLALVTMTLGNFAAATQDKVKRMLAYSSIGHAGYALIGIAVLTGTADQSYALGASMLHLFVYGFMNTGAFLFVALVEYWGVGRTFEDYNGLAKQAPVACFAMTIFLFSLAGLPIGGGALSKWALLSATASAATLSAYLLAAALIVNSALSLFYYSRVVKAMWIEDPAGDFEVSSYPTGLYAAVVGAAIVTFLLLPAFGVVSGTAFDAAAALF